jgi:hypothetical protein
VLFQLYSGRRAELIEKNEFYLQQAQLRLLSQFSEEDIRKEADEEGERYLKEHEHLFDPERHDPEDFYEAAGDHLIDHYQMLSDMRDNVRLSIMAGLFHEWEKSLRQWLVDEIRHWHLGKDLQDAIWKKSFASLMDLLENFGWKVRKSPWFNDLDACRLVVNVFKHGNGPSLSELIGTYPQFYRDPFGDLTIGTGDACFYASYEFLKVTDEDVKTFSDAISTFWREIPKNICDTQIQRLPKWFVTAYEKGHMTEGDS